LEVKSSPDKLNSENESKIVANKNVSSDSGTQDESKFNIEDPTAVNTAYQKYGANEDTDTVNRVIRSSDNPSSLSIDLRQDGNVVRTDIQNYQSKQSDGGEESINQNENVCTQQCTSAPAPRLCSWFQKGMCRYGPGCRDRHIMPHERNYEDSESFPQQPSNYYHPNMFPQHTAAYRPLHAHHSPMIPWPGYNFRHNNFHFQNASGMMPQQVPGILSQNSYPRPFQNPMMIPSPPRGPNMMPPMIPFPRPTNIPFHQPPPPVHMRAPLAMGPGPQPPVVNGYPHQNNA